VASNCFPLKLILTFIFCTSGSAFPQTWEAVFITDKGVPYFIDPASVLKVGSEVHFTQLSNYDDGFRYNGHVVYSIKVFKRANCENASYKSGALIAYSKIYAAGEIELVDFDLSKKWRNIVPTSTAAAFQERVCGFNAASID
jgi:hypothetical protein